MSNATAASTTSSAAAPAKTPNVNAFFTPKDSKGMKISLWITHKTKDTSPDVDGAFGATRVAGWIHSGPTGKFVSFIDSKAGKDDQGHFKQLGTGRVVVNEHGIPKLAIRLYGVEGTVWAEVSRKAPQDLLVAMGLNLQVLEQKRAAAAERKRVAASAKAAHAAEADAVPA